MLPKLIWWWNPFCMCTFINIIQNILQIYIIQNIRIQNTYYNHALRTYSTMIKSLHTYCLGLNPSYDIYWVLDAGQVIILSVPQVPHLENRNNNNTALRLLWDSNESLYFKCLVECMAHSKHSIMLPVIIVTFCVYLQKTTLA